MLSEKLKNKGLFEELNTRKKQEAREMLYDAAEMLVIAMRTAEEYANLEREDVEATVMRLLELNEQKYYECDEDAFDIIVRDFLR